MSVSLGYLIPTRETVMEGAPETAPLLDLAQRAETLGFGSLWVGDSLTARPRHEPLTLLAAIAARTATATLGTAVLLPALRNPVAFAQAAATLDRIAEGRLVLGVGIAADAPPIRAEFAAAGVPFERRVGRLQEALTLARQLWTGEPVDWDGRWQLHGQSVGPTPHRPGGPPLWTGGSHPNALARAGRFYDGWMPLGPDDPARWRGDLDTVRGHAADAGRGDGAVAASLYATLCVDERADRADALIDDFLQRYYGVPGPVMRRIQACCGGGAEQIGDWLDGFVEAGVEHLVLRFAGDHARHLETVAALAAERGW